MIVFATVQSLLRRLFVRDVARTTPARRAYPRAACHVCGREFALTTRGAWKHRCRPVLTLDPAGTMRRPEAGFDVVGHAGSGPSAPGGEAA